MFIVGHEYRRSELHDQFGGSRQSGISPSAQQPLLFVFTGESGEQHGYTDVWREGKFYYTGEGQTGDMTLTKGNLAIAQHVDQGRDLHVFQSTRKAYVRYLGQFVCTSWKYSTGEVSGVRRRTIEFELTPAAEFDSATLGSSSDEIGAGQSSTRSLEELRNEALGDSREFVEGEKRTSTYRKRSAAIRVYARARAAGICEGCDSPAPFMNARGEAFLEVHHLRRLTDSGPDHPEWVAAICPNCHRRAHHASDREEFNRKVREKIVALESASRKT